MSVIQRLKNAWNVFTNKPHENDPYIYNVPFSISSIQSPSTPRLNRSNIKTIVGSVYNHIAVDCAAMDLKHVRLDEEDKFKEVIKDDLNYILTRRANKDQTGRELIKDIVISMLDEGVVAVVPFCTEGNPNLTDQYDILEVRTARIVQWSPDDVLVRIYNEYNGQYEEKWVAKKYTLIIENPFYLMMNEPNSTAQQLKTVLAQLDRTNHLNSSGKLDLIIQLPFPIKSKARTEQAEMRRKEIEEQLSGSQLGIAYTDVTEKIVQLNRSLENNLWEQAEGLKSELYNLLGFSETILNGTADEKTMLNYYNRTIEPILTAIVEEMECKWLTKTAITQGQAIRFFRNHFKLVPLLNLAEIVDKFTRNEIMSSNEFRSIMGLKPSDEPNADKLINSNINHPDEGEQQNEPKEMDEENGAKDYKKNSKIQNEVEKEEKQ